MNEEDKEIIKKLAKKSLKEKWYPLREGDDTIDKRIDCSFCFDVEERRKIIERKTEEEYCAICYIEILIPCFCYDIDERSIEETIAVLEKLAEYGELKNEQTRK